MTIEIIISQIDFYVIERLREIRVKSTPYIDQVELSQRIGVSEGYIGQIENPKSRAKYNLRMIAKAARALNLKSYQEIFPSEILSDDLVKIRLKLLKSNKKKHEIESNGNIKKRFEIISTTPLTNEEIIMWNDRKLKYLKIIKD
ncbi:helix-turn-helix domain-containing protein [Mesonia mobilis]|uniref:helix-turn-helix domain-containing protein n=1 Tax=Mesonia mobilis TaxID=369791 RepID=UPI0026F125B1|nr:helix-turn-helix transcriptional regulator [Mesonia mobilis]